MLNGLGAGFTTLALLAILVGLALFVVVSTLGAYLLARRTGCVPLHLRYPFVALCAVVVAVAGYGIYSLYDAAPSLAALFLLLVAVPLVALSVSLTRSAASGWVAVISTAVMAWAPSFLLGVAVVFGVLNGTNEALDFTTKESRQLGIQWIAALAGGVTITLGMIPISSRLGRLFPVLLETGAAD